MTTEGPVVKRARTRDCRSLARNIREEDALEILLATGASPEQELTRQMSKPDTVVFSIHHEHRVLGMFGVSRVTRVPINVGAPWLLASNELFDNHWRRFVREGKAWMDTLSRGFSLLENYAYSGNQSHVDWLRAVGFELVELVPYGVAKQPF